MYCPDTRDTTTWLGVPLKLGLGLNSSLNDATGTWRQKNKTKSLQSGLIFPKYFVIKVTKKKKKTLSCQRLRTRVLLFYLSFLFFFLFENESGRELSIFSCTVSDISFAQYQRKKERKKEKEPATVMYVSRKGTYQWCSSSCLCIWLTHGLTLTGEEHVNNNKSFMGPLILKFSPKEWWKLMWKSKAPWRSSAHKISMTWLPYSYVSEKHQLFPLNTCQSLEKHSMHDLVNCV